MASKTQNSPPLLVLLFATSAVISAAIAAIRAAAATAALAVIFVDCFDEDFVITGSSGCDSDLDCGKDLGWCCLQRRCRA